MIQGIISTFIEIDSEFKVLSSFYVYIYITAFNNLSYLTALWRYPIIYIYIYVCVCVDFFPFLTFRFYSSVRQHTTIDKL